MQAVPIRAPASPQGRPASLRHAGRVGGSLAGRQEPEATADRRGAARRDGVRPLRGRDRAVPCQARSTGQVAQAVHRRAVVHPDGFAPLQLEGARADELGQLHAGQRQGGEARCADQRRRRRCDDRAGLRGDEGRADGQRPGDLPVLRLRRSELSDVGGHPRRHGEALGDDQGRPPRGRRRALPGQDEGQDRDEDPRTGSRRRKARLHRHRQHRDAGGELERVGALAERGDRRRRQAPHTGRHAHRGVRPWSERRRRQAVVLRPAQHPRQRGGREGERDQGVSGRVEQELCRSRRQGDQGVPATGDRLAGAEHVRGADVLSGLREPEAGHGRHGPPDQ